MRRGRTATRRRPGRTANIFDVARLAGVSHQTVSRVINDLPNVRPATRARVEQAIAQLRYSPSPAARALVTRRTRTIGLVTPGVVGLRADVDRDALQLRGARRPVQRRDGELARSDDRAGIRGGGRRPAPPARRRDRADRGRRRRAGAGARPGPQRPGRRLGVHRPPEPPDRVDRPVPRCPRRRSATWPSWGTIGSCTWPARSGRPTRSSGCVGGATSSPRTGSRSSSPKSATGRRPAGTASGSELDVEPGIRRLRRQRPHGDRRAVGAARARPARARGRQRRRLRRRARGRLPVPAAHHGPPGLRARSAS